MRVHIGCDHAGFDLKLRLVEIMRSSGHEVVDHGPFVLDPLDDYPPFCLRVGEAVVADPGSLGVVLGGSGNGEQMAANKVDGIRAALAYDEQTARLAREHNDANVLSLGARMQDETTLTAVLQAFLSTPFSGEDRHSRRLAMLTEYERWGTLPPLH